MEKEIVVHIGVRKTGSSSLQKFLAFNNDVLNASDWCYPNTRKNFWNTEVEEPGRWTNGGGDTYEAGVLGHDAIWKKEFDDFTKILDSSLRRYNVILSSEGIWSRKYGIPFIAYLKQQYKYVRLVVYLRRQDVRMESENAQRIKRIVEPYGVNRKITIMALEEYCDYVMTKKEQDIGDVCDEYAYFGRLQEFEDIVGKQNLAVYTYEEAKQVGLLCHFVGILGLQYEQFYKIENINITPSVMDTEIKRRLNTAFISKSDSLIKQIEGAYWGAGMKSDTKKGHLLSPEERRRILAYYAEDNKKVAERYFHRQNLFSDKIDYPQVKLDETEILKNYTKTLEQMLIRMCYELL